MYEASHVYISLYMIRLMNYQFLVLSIKCTIASNLIFLGKVTCSSNTVDVTGYILKKKTSQDLLLMDIVPSKIFTDAQQKNSGQKQKITLNLRRYGFRVLDYKLDSMHIKLTMYLGRIYDSFSINHATLETHID